MATKRSTGKHSEPSTGKGKPPSVQTENHTYLTELYGGQIKTAEKEIESLKKEIEELKKQNEPSMILSSPVEEKSNEKYINNLKKQYDELEERFVKEDEKHRNAEKRAHEEIEKLKKENERLKKKHNEESKSHSSPLDRNLGEKYNNLKMQYDVLEECFSEEERKRQHAEERLRDDRKKHADNLKREIEKQQKRIKVLEKENSELQSDIEKRKEQSKKEHVDQMNEKLKTKIKEQQQRIETLETENKELQSDLEKRKDDSKKQRNQSVDEVLQLKRERDILLNRLGQLAGPKVGGDTTISNHSNETMGLKDKNRPIQLAEKFSELYDNEWTDALEEQMEGGKKSEEEGISLLLDIVKKAYTFSSKQAKTFYKSLTEGIKSLGLPDEKAWLPGVSKEMKDHRKSIAVFVSNSISKKFLKEGIAFEKATSKYAETCASICWFMCVQDPPVYMDPESPKGNFNTDKYRGYTKTGNEYKYLVWPPLYLHKGGPMLGKGVAQGK